MFDTKMSKRLNYHQLSNINLFMRAVEFESLTKVAEELDVSKSTVSKAIRLLEDAIEMPLFSRNHKNFKLTPEGDAFYHECIKIEREVLNIFAHIEDVQTELEGVLTINVVRSLLCHHFLDIITKYQEIYPKVHINLITHGSIFTGHIRGDIDLYIAPHKSNLPAHVHKVDVLRTTSMLCASSDYIKVHGMPQTLRDLANHHLILLRRYPSTYIESIAEKLKKENIDFRSRLEINSTNAIKDCVFAGLGISELPRSIIASELEKGEIISILPQFNSHHQLYAYYAVYDDVIPAKVSRFLAMLRKKM
ncbi:LysR family transcriptional regulator [Cysteiniphilum halobium]|uniref:LysR family transcriptional regulator n=1 Tax=Cysteiniphilum halobium TaxID=2219059 RepID=UPI003F83955B